MEEFQLKAEGLGEGPLGKWTTELVSLDFMNRPGSSSNRKEIIDFNDRGDIVVNVTSWTAVWGSAPTYYYRVWFFNGSDSTWRKLSTVGGQEPGLLIAHDTAINNWGEVAGVEYTDYWGIGAPRHFLMTPGWHWLTDFPAFDIHLLDPEGSELADSFGAGFRPTWINDWGEFTGNYWIETENQWWSGSWYFDGFEHDATMTGTDPVVRYRDLLPEGYTHQTVRGLNNWPQILVSGSTNDQEESPEDFEVFLVNGPQRVALSALSSVPAISDHTYENSMPVAINNRGAIIGWANSGNSLYLLTLNQDRDGDGMSNDWETFHGLDPDDPSDALDDPDGDGANNLAEFRLGSAPTSTGYRLALDSDGDGLPDAWERKMFGTLSANPAGDNDGDGLDNWEEWVIGSDPHLSDSDGDGWDDFEEFFIRGTDPSNADTDGDGIPDLAENLAGSDPKDPVSRPRLPPYLRVEVKTVTHSELIPDEFVTPEFYYWAVHVPLDSTYNQGFSSALFDLSLADRKNDGMDQSPLKNTRLVSDYPGTEDYSFSVLLITTIHGNGDPQVLNVEMKEFMISAGQKVSNEIATEAEQEGLVYLRPVELAPEVLAVNSDFGEGRIDPATGYAIPDCDDMPGVDQKTGSGNTQIALDASRAHLDGLFANDEKVTDDLNQGWFGVNPSLMESDFWDGGTVTIWKLDKIDVDTGYKESGQVRFYAKWSDDDYYGISPYDFDTLQPVNLVSAGVNKRPGEGVYGSTSTIPNDAEFWMESVRPGKITLEWRLQKGDIDVSYEQTFKICTEQSKEQWFEHLRYMIKLQTVDDPTGSSLVFGLGYSHGGQVDVFATTTSAAGYGTNVERASEYYDFYEQSWNQNNNLGWSGLAKVVGAQVISGINDAQWGIVGQLGFVNVSGWLAGFDLDDIKEFQQELLKGGEAIFKDIAWQHHAYLASGIWALEFVHKNQDGGANPEIPDEVLSGWKLIDEGSEAADASKILNGSIRIADYEKNAVIVNTYTRLHSIGSGPLVNAMSSLAVRPVQGGDHFRDVVGLGAQLSNTAQRWTWVTAVCLALEIQEKRVYCRRGSP